MDAITLGRTNFQDFSVAEHTEWLETNGLGGYASQSIICSCSRRQHGLLIVPTKAPLGRKSIVNNVCENVVVNGREHSICSQRYISGIMDGSRHMVYFSYTTYPKFVFKFANLWLEKSIIMLDQRNVTIVMYENKSGNKILLKLTPVFSFRDIHGLVGENERVYEIKSISSKVVNVCCARMEVYVVTSKGKFYSNRIYHKGLRYIIEEENGYDSIENLFSVGHFEAELGKNEKVYIAFSLGEVYRDIDGEFMKEVKRRERLMILKGDEFFNRLKYATNAFLVSRNSKKTIIAGYHYFEDWGRDTFISLPGICLVPGKYKQAKEILIEFSKYMDCGIVPNRFQEIDNIPVYNTVDASLWYIYSVQKYVEYAKDFSILKLLKSKLFEIINSYKNGTKFNIHMDDDCLIFAGQEGLQLTWMDAKVGDMVITPRIGKPVEIQALWYNALMFLSNHLDKSFYEIAKIAKKNFNKKFWNAEKKYLYDVIDIPPNNSTDSSIRPNALFSISLPYSILENKYFKCVVDKAYEKLFTPFGLRSLSPDDEKYKGIYHGDILSRDLAYHQGTVWAYLIGCFVDAYFKAYGKNRKTIEFFRNIIQNFKHHVSEAGIGFISEIFDGDSPHKPKGCIAQAWSVAELLRVIHEHMGKWRNW